MSPSPTRIWIGVTDNDWFSFLRSQPLLDEVNFWQPSGRRAFRALQPGDLFLFKLHSPHDYIVGGGFFVRYVEHRLRASAPLMVAEMTEPAQMWSEPGLVRHRLGQGTFRALITDNYQRRCAVTGEKALPVLDAAHIRPVGAGGQHRLDNGLLLRTDVHRLFDAGYVTVTPDGRFLVSRRLKVDFDNGEPYMPFNDQRIWMPGDPVDRPDQRALEWHADEVFLR